MRTKVELREQHGRSPRCRNGRPARFAADLEYCRLRFERFDALRDTFEREINPRGIIEHM
jgi:hypothetical protein